MSTMSNPLAAVCQMTSIGDKEKNYQVVKSLVEEAKNRKACVSNHQIINSIFSNRFKIFIRLHFFLRLVIIWLIIKLTLSLKVSL